MQREEKLQDSQRKRTFWQTQFECKATWWMLSVCTQSGMRRNTKCIGEECGFWQGQGSSALLRWNRMEQHVAETMQATTASRDQRLYNSHQCQPGPPIPAALGVPIADPVAAPLWQFSTSLSIVASCCQSPPCLFSRVWAENNLTLDKTPNEAWLHLHITWQVFFSLREGKQHQVWVHKLIKPNMLELGYQVQECKKSLSAEARMPKPSSVSQRSGHCARRGRPRITVSALSVISCLYPITVQHKVPTKAGSLLHTDLLAL